SVDLSKILIWLIGHRLCLNNRHLAFFLLWVSSFVSSFFFFFNDPAPTEIYTLSLHDALPISSKPANCGVKVIPLMLLSRTCSIRSEEHTSELQSRGHLVCRLLLEKKKPTFIITQNRKLF